MSLKVVVVTLVSLLCMNTVRSQSDELLVQGQTGSLYLQHTVEAKENWYSIGRLYNANPKELATYNKLVMTQPLSIGQSLQIPLNTVNFSQNGVKVTGETLVPLYYIVQEKEWMYRISVNHNKVPIANLEKWNNINKDQVRAGMHLIVGYLKVKTALSALAKMGGGPKTDAGTVARTDAGTGVKTNTVTTPRTDTTPKTRVDARTAAKVSVTDEGTKTAMNAGPAKDTMTHTVTKPETVAPATAASAGGVKPVSASGKSFNGGYFRNDFSDGGRSAAGLAGIFKSTSGWQDGKYYALMNNIPVGTIIKVTDGTSGKIVYAKVLGQLPDMKESAGLTIRISNAAAGELGEGDGRFNVDVRY